MSSIFMRVSVLAIALCALEASAQSLSAADGEVDVQLVLAADVSGSIGANLALEQRKGFAAAFREPDLQRAISSGLNGRIAVTYFEWSGVNDQRVIVPWQVLSTPAEVMRFAETLEASSHFEGGGSTSVSGALDFAGHLIKENGLTSARKVVDISGNGKNNKGPEVKTALEALLDNGVTVNGLVLPAADDGPFGRLFARLEGPIIDYYRDHVIGGPGAFAIEVGVDQGLTDAILRKLVLEIAWAGSGGGER